VSDDRYRRFMDRAVRLACRGHGGAEPNPMVGCVILDARGEPAGEGFHARCGGPHAEVEALRAAGERARGGMAIVTLEPCAHRGRTGPCADALVEAGIARVIYAVSDPNPVARGGAVRLSEAGVEVVRMAHAGAELVARPFVKRVTTGLPWVAAKWAQSIDGAIALASGESKWISSARSRAMVHRERGRVDAIMTGIGTVLADDPQLSPRGVRIARVAQRIVFDPAVEMPPDAKVCDGSAPTTILVAADLSGAARARLRILEARGIRSVSLGADGSIEDALRALAGSGIATVLVESGGGLVGRLVREGLLDEAWVFVAPLVVADDAAGRCARGLERTALAGIDRGRIVSVRMRGPDALLHYRFDSAPSAPPR